VTGQWIEVTTCPAGGAIIFTAGLLVPGIPLFVANYGANALLIFPPSTGQWNTLGANIAFTLSNGLSQSFWPVSNLQAYSQP
jgi:hypothetical protein